MTARTRHGLRLTTGPGYWWRTEDGTTEIARISGIEYCDHPHPLRYRDQSTGRMVHDYCDGEQGHDRDIGWGIQGNRRGLADDLYDTLDEAWAALADALLRTPVQS